MEGEFLVPFEISSEPTETLPCFGSENATVGEWHVAQDWFLYFDNIDLRRHLQDIEIVLIEAALENSTGQVSQASGMLKLRRTTLIEKMKKLAIEKPLL